MRHVNNLDSKVKWKTRNVDWDKFTKAVEDAVDKIDRTKQLSMKEEVNQFRKILDTAADAHVGKTKPGKNSATWITPPVRAAIKRRNALRQKIKTHWKRVKKQEKKPSKRKRRSGGITWRMQLLIQMLEKLGKSSGPLMVHSKQTALMRP